MWGRQQWQHYVIIYKVTKKEITVMDPAYGRMQRYTYEDFQKIWSGVLILFAKSDDFKTTNEKVSAISRFWELIQPHKTILFQALFRSCNLHGLRIINIYIHTKDYRLCFG